MSTDTAVSDNTIDDSDEAWFAEYALPLRAFQERLVSLEGAGIRQAISTLELIKADLWGFITDLKLSKWLGMEEAELHGMMYAFERQLKNLQKTEGVDLATADRSLGTCIRLAVSFCLFIHSYYKTVPGAELSPKLIKMLDRFD